MAITGLPYIDSKKAVLGNILNFNIEVKTSTYLQGKLGQFRDWYFNAENEIFGPSKYIGYVDMNEQLYKEYKAKYNELPGFSGTNTERILHQWFKPTNRFEAPEIYAKLELFLSRYGKRINKLGVIWVDSV